MVAIGRRPDSIALGRGGSSELGKLDPAELEWWRTKLAPPAEVLNPPPLVTGERSSGAWPVCPDRCIARLLQEVRQRQLDGELTSREEALRWLRQFLAEPISAQVEQQGRLAQRLEWQLVRALLRGSCRDALAPYFLLSTPDGPAFSKYGTCWRILLDTAQSD